MPQRPADGPTTGFIREYFPFAWRVLRRLGLSPADADDAAQRVMLIAAQRRKDIALGRERAFLYRTAAFLVARERRSVRRRPESAGLDLDEHEHPGGDPETLLVERQQREWLDSVLERMQPDLRAAFVLFEIEGMTRDEVAHALEVPAGTAASRVRRAREEFAKRARQLALAERAKGATA